jgi:cellulose 1,4-beta-cellobiosidase
VSLSWPASVGATGYHVKRAAVDGGPYASVACPTTTSYVDTGLTNNTTYYYVVSAAYTGGADAGGESADSSQASATPQPLPPPTPTGLTATPGNAQVSLAWTASSGATSYNVKRAGTSGGPYTIVGTPTSTSFLDTGLTNGTPYYYVVSAVNSGGASGNSSEVNATPQSVAPAPPTALTAKATAPKKINLHWTQSPSAGVTQNGIYRRLSNGSYPPTPTATISATASYNDTGLSSHMAYCYSVTAFSGGGESAKSNESCATAK